MVACGPPGPAAGKNLLYHNNGDGTLTDVSKKSGIWDPIGNYALSVAVSHLDVTCARTSDWTRRRQWIHSKCGSLPAR
jgi:hypothetical protein